jgi:hypothetical protein
VRILIPPTQGAVDALVEPAKAALGGSVHILFLVQSLRK